MPPGATLLASSQRCPVEMYTVGDHVLCIQVCIGRSRLWASTLCVCEGRVVGKKLLLLMFVCASRCPYTAAV